MCQHLLCLLADFSPSYWSQVCDSLFRSLWFSRRRVEDLRFGHRVSLNHELAPRRFPFFTSGENRVLRLWRRTRTHSLLDTFVKNYFADAENESLRAAARHISFCCKMFRERIKRGEHARTRGRRAPTSALLLLTFGVLEIYLSCEWLSTMSWEDCDVGAESLSFLLAANKFDSANCSKCGKVKRLAILSV